MLPKPKSIEEAKTLVRSLGRPEMRFASSITAPLYWVTKNSDGSIGTRNGSAFFLETKEALFGITAAHVVEGERSWREHCKIHGPTPLRLGGWKGTSLVLDWDERLIDIDSKIDTATFKISREEIAHVNRSVFTGLQSTWPPVPPQEWQQVSYCGFAAVETRQISRASVEFGVLYGAGLASSVSPLNISSLFERQYAESISGVALPPENFNFGGISGGPMIYVTEEHKGLRLNVLAGVINSGPNTSDNPEEAIAGLEIIRARRACFIQANGLLDRSLWDTLSQ
jgi:hypothetical protein